LGCDETGVDYQLKGKLAYVSAGAHGIGEAIADLLTQEGAEVIVADADGDALRQKAGKWRGTVAADLSTAAGVDAATTYALSQFGRAPDILINNLGVGNSTPFEDTSDEMWARSFEVNLMGTVRTCRALVPQMASRGGGAVVNTGSDLAKQPEPGFVDYGTCKAGLLYLSKALAKQYAPIVRVNTVLPGPIWSRMWTRPGGIVDQLVAHYGLDRDASVKKFLEDRQMPMGIGNPADVAHAVVFLASPLAKFITGAALDIGGTIRGLI
jgi:NAD(P)-dependent dehydrogenase (short-subunit alcohol dehydrogenase family)